MSIKQPFSSPLSLFRLVLRPVTIRRFATTPCYCAQPPFTASEKPRWLSDTKDRIGRLFFHGATPEESREAGEILSLLTKNWREYIAGSEGFLTGEKRQGFRHRIEWNDMDSMGRVDNVTYIRWVESARINWAWNFAKNDPENRSLWAELWTFKGPGLILKSIQVDYKFPLERPDKVTVYHKLSRVDDSSFTLGAIILSEKHQRPAAWCMEDIVVGNYEPKDNSPPGRASLPEFVRTQFESTLQLQKEAVGDALDSIRDINARVDGLEMKVMSREEMT